MYCFLYWGFLEKGSDDTMNYPKKTGFNLYQSRHNLKTWFLKNLSVSDQLFITLYMIYIIYLFLCIQTVDSISSEPFSRIPMYNILFYLQKYQNKVVTIRLEYMLIMLIMCNYAEYAHIWRVALFDLLRPPRL